MYIDLDLDRLHLRFHLFHIADRGLLLESDASTVKLAQKREDGT